MRLLVLALLAAFAAADAPVKNDKRKLARWVPISTPWRALQLAEGVDVAEGQKGMRDAFPYWVAARGATEETREAHAVTPENIAHFLKKTDGKVITNEHQALELVRTFVAGPIVTTSKAAERVIETARGLEGVDLKITEHRPKSYAPVVTGAEGRWSVSFVALEVTGRMQLVHVTASVDESGRLAIDRAPIVDGPQLSWQTAFVSAPSKGELERERRSRERVHDAMLRCLKAVGLEPDLETGWVLARVFRAFADVRRVLGDPTKVWGAAAVIWEYHHADGSKLTFGGGGKDRARVQAVIYTKRKRDGGPAAVEARYFSQ